MLIIPGRKGLIFMNGSFIAALKGTFMLFLIYCKRICAQKEEHCGEKRGRSHFLVVDELFYADDDDTYYNAEYNDRRN